MSDGARLECWTDLAGGGVLDARDQETELRLGVVDGSHLCDFWWLIWVIDLGEGR